MSLETCTLGGVECLTAKGKADLLRGIAETRGLRVFVETGTHNGDTLAAVMAEPELIDRAFSVELSSSYFERAVARFAKDTRVALWFGDSAAVLREHFLPALHQPALFWLDAHPGEPGTAGTYGESPLRDELRAIVAAPRLDHVILVDDARLFEHPGWPSLDEIRSIASGWYVELHQDIVRITRTHT